MAEDHRRPDDSPLSDVELLQRWRDGDRQAGDHLFNRHFSTIYRFFLRRSPQDVAQDLTQRTFLACAEKREIWHRDVPFRIYALGIARRMLLFHYRTQARQNDRIRKLSITPWERDAVSLGSLEANHHERALLLSGLRSLKQDEQTVLGLYYWEGLKVSEIAQLLSTPTGTVKWRLAQARERLRTHIKNHEAPEALKASTFITFDRWVNGLRRSEEDSHL